MKRSDQYRTFYPFYEAEEKRYSELTQRATILLSLVSGFALFAGVSTDDLQEQIIDSLWTLIPLSISGVALLSSALAAVVSLAVRNYKDICDVEKLVIEAEEGSYDEEDIYSVLLANLADAVAHNRNINHSRAIWLLYSTISLSVSVVLFIFLNALAIAVTKGVLK
jgi:hypothetical protein